MAPSEPKANVPDQKKEVENPEFETPYPNELEEYKLYEKYCQGLKPGVSTDVDTNRVFGKQKKNSWERQRIYEKDNWGIYVSFFWDDGFTPRYLLGKVKNIDFISKEKLSFEKQTFSNAFIKQDVYAAVTWHDYRDAHGLVYSVYNGGERKGNLNRISYRLPPHVVAGARHYLLRVHLDEKKARQEADLKASKEVPLKKRTSEEDSEPKAKEIPKTPDPDNPFD